MSDLISRKVLYEEIARLEELARGRVLDTPSPNPCYARYSAQLNERTSLKHIIADMPTAYDADNVDGQMEACRWVKGLHSFETCWSDVSIKDYKKYAMRFCPKCGKKIKVVE